MSGCPDRENGVWLYFFEEMPEEHQEAFAAHLNRCGACRSEYHRFQEMIGKAKAAGRTPMLNPERADAMTRDILERIGAGPGASVRGRLPVRKLFAGAAAACVLVLAVGIFSYRALDRQPETPATTGMQASRPISPEQVETMPDIELLMEFQTIEKIVKVLDVDTPSRDDRRNESDTNALGNESDVPATQLA